MAPSDHNIALSILAGKRKCELIVCRCMLLRNASNATADAGTSHIFPLTNSNRFCYFRK